MSQEPVANVVFEAATASSTSPTQVANRLQFPMLTKNGRICLRRLREEDLRDFQKYRSSLELSKYQGWTPQTDDLALQFLRSMAEPSKITPGLWVQIGIASCSDDRLIGDIGFFLSESLNLVELGITLCLEHHGNGFAQESMTTLMQNIFEAIPRVNQVLCIVDSRNHSCIKLLCKLNMSPISSESATFKGEVCEEITYQLQRCDFNAVFSGKKE